MNSESIIKVNKIAMKLMSLKYSSFMKEFSLQNNNWEGAFDKFCNYIGQNDGYMNYVNFLEYYIKSKG